MMAGSTAAKLSAKDISNNNNRKRLSSRREKREKLRQQWSSCLRGGKEGER